MAVTKKPLRVLQEVTVSYITFSRLVHFPYTMSIRWLLWDCEVDRDGRSIGSGGGGAIRGGEEAGEVTTVQGDIGSSRKEDC